MYLGSGVCHPTSAKIDKYDLGFKAIHAMKFLQNGDKVKVSIRFKGGEMKYSITGKEVFKKFSDMVLSFGTVEK